MSAPGIPHSPDATTTRVFRRRPPSETSSSGGIRDRFPEEPEIRRDGEVRDAGVVEPEGPERNPGALGGHGDLADAPTRAVVVQANVDAQIHRADEEDVRAR